MSAEKLDLLKAITESVDDLHQEINTHRCLVARLLVGNLKGEQLARLLDACPSRSREDKLKAALKEAIDVLDESRKAFKSKQLERLRKQLTHVLIDTP